MRGPILAGVRVGYKVLQASLAEGRYKISSIVGAVYRRDSVHKTESYPERRGLGRVMSARGRHADVLGNGGAVRTWIVGSDHFGLTIRSKRFHHCGRAVDGHGGRLLAEGAPC